MDNEDIFAEDHIPDPVATAAAKEAVEATNPEVRHPWISRVAMFFAAIIILAGTFGAVIGSINTVSLRQQDKELKADQAQIKSDQQCISQLLLNFELEQKARIVIAADDRKVIDDILANLSNGVPFKTALAVYKKERNQNESRRNALPAIPDPSSCTSNIKGQAVSSGKAITITIPPKTPVTTPTPGTTPGNGGSSGNGGTTTHKTPTPSKSPGKSTKPPKVSPPPTLGSGSPLGLTLLPLSIPFPTSIPGTSIVCTQVFPILVIDCK